MNYRGAIATAEIEVETDAAEIDGGIVAVESPDSTLFDTNNMYISSIPQFFTRALVCTIYFQGGLIN